MPRASRVSRPPSIVAVEVESLRSLVLDDLAWGSILPGFLVVAVSGALMLALNVRLIQHYD